MRVRFPKRYISSQIPDKCSTLGRGWILNIEGSSLVYGKSTNFRPYYYRGISQALRCDEPSFFLSCRSLMLLISEADMGESVAQSENRESSNIPDAVWERFEREFGDYPAKDKAAILDRIMADYAPPTWR